MKREPDPMPDDLTPERLAELRRLVADSEKEGKDPRIPRVMAITLLDMAARCAAAEGERDRLTARLEECYLPLNFELEAERDTFRKIAIARQNEIERLLQQLETSRSALLVAVENNGKVSNKLRAENAELQAKLHRYTRWACKTCGCSFGNPCGDVELEGVKECTSCVEVKHLCFENAELRRELEAAELERDWKEKQVQNARKESDYERNRTNDAADEIDRLRAENAELRRQIEGHETELGNLRLLVALTETRAP